VDDGWAVAPPGPPAEPRWLSVRRWAGNQLGEVLFERDLAEDHDVLATTLASDGADATQGTNLLRTLVWERQAGRVVAASSRDADTPLPYTGPPFGRSLATRASSAPVPTEALAFYAQRVETLTPEQHEAAQAAACRGMRARSLCGRVSGMRVVEDWVELLTLTGSAPRAQRLAVRTSGRFEELTVAIDASSGGAAIALFTPGTTDRVRLDPHWLARDGTVVRHASRPLPARWFPGTIAHRSDGAAFLVLPTLGAEDEYGSLRVLALDARGRQLARGVLPIEGPSFEGSFGSLECGGALWLVTQQTVAARRRVAVVATRVDERGRLAAPTAVGELPISEGTPPRHSSLENEPMRYGCREGEAAVGFRDPSTLDPGTGELAVFTWRADAR